MTLRRTAAAAAALAISLHLAGCDRQPPAPPAATAVPQTPDEVQPATVVAAQPTAEAPATYARQPSPDTVLRGWGAAIERRDWAAVRALWGNHGEDSGLDPKTFAARWDHLRQPRVTIGTVDQEGAAGSIYYTAAVTVRDGARRTAGTVTLRRVNNVDGATTEQLLWHIDAATREPWTNP